MKNNVYYGKKIHPDYYYQQKYHGFIKYYGEIVKVNKYFGCFFTLNSIDSAHLPENLKNNLRVCCLIEPDLKRITSALVASSGLTKGINKSDELATKLVDFLEFINISQVKYLQVL